MQEVYTLPDTNIAPWKMVVGSWGDYLPFGKPYFLGLLLPVLGGFCALDWGLVGFFSNSIYHLFFWPTRRSNDVNNLWALRSQQNDLFRGPSFQRSEQSVSNVIINDININHSSTSPFIFDHHTCWDQGAFFGVQVVNILNNSSHSRNMWLLVVWNKWASNMKPGERAHGFLCSKKKLTSITFNASNEKLKFRGFTSLILSNFRYQYTSQSKEAVIWVSGLYAYILRKAPFIFKNLRSPTVDTPRDFCVFLGRLEHQRLGMWSCGIFEEPFINDCFKRMVNQIFTWATRKKSSYFPLKSIIYWLSNTDPDNGSF